MTTPNPYIESLITVYECDSGIVEAGLAEYQPTINWKYRGRVEYGLKKPLKEHDIMFLAHNIKFSYVAYGHPADRDA